MTTYERIKALYDTGHKSLKDLMAQTGLGKSTVIYHLARVRKGVVPGRVGANLPDAARKYRQSRKQEPPLRTAPPVEPFREMLRVDISTGGVRYDRRKEVFPWLTG